MGSMKQDLTIALEASISDIRAALIREDYRSEASISDGVVRRLIADLGWPPYDTRVVFPQYLIGNRKVDFALCHPRDKPVVLLEVKNVGQAGERGELQLFEYCFHQGVPIAVLTDGRIWRLFYPAGEGSYADRLFCEMDLVNGSAAEIADGFIRYLAYSAIDSGDAQRRVREDCKAMQLQRQAAAIFPSVWDKLILGPDPLLVELFEEEVEAESGVRPRKQHVVAFIKEKGTSRITPSPVTRPLSRSLISAPPDPSTARYNSEHTLAAFLDNLLAEAQGTGTTWAEASKVACAEATRRGHKTRQTPATLKAHARYRGFVVLEGEKVDLLSPSVSNQAAVEVTPPADKWEPLTNLNPPSSQRPSCPAAIRFWDGSERPLKAWREILRSVVEKLNGDEKLTVNDLPIRSGSKRYCVHTKPFHPTGVGFTSPRSVGDGSLFVEAHVSSKAAREYAKLVLEHCGQNPEEVYLQVK